MIIYIYFFFHLVLAFLSMAIVLKLDGFITLGGFAWMLLTGPIGFVVIMICQSCMSDEIIVWRKER